MNNGEVVLKKGKQLNRKTKKAIFCACVLIVPLIQFVIFYCGVNLNSFRLAFTNYEGDFVWFDNFAKFFNEFVKYKNWRAALKNSAIIYLLNFVTMQPLGILMSYLVYKKLNKAWAQVIMTILCIPMVMSPIVLTTIYQYFVDIAVPEIIVKLTGQKIGGLFSTVETRFWAIFFYSFWHGFGSGIILNCNFLKGIPESVIEAAKLDGVTFMQELWYIGFPYLFRLWKLNFVLGIPGILTNQFSLYEFYGLDNTPSDLFTVGYYLFKLTLSGGPKDYPYLSAVGLIITIVILPVAFGTRAVLNKLDPMEN